MNLDASDCNGSSSKPLLRPSLIGSGSSFASSGTPPNHSVLKPATLGNPFARAVDLGVDDSSTTTQQVGSSRRGSETDPTESKQSLLVPSRLNVNTAGSSPTAPAAACEGNEESPEMSTNQAVLDPVVPSAAPRPSLTSGSLFSTTVTSATVSSVAAPPTPTSCANFVFGQKLHERVAVCKTLSI